MLHLVRWKNWFYLSGLQGEHAMTLVELTRRHAFEARSGTCASLASPQARSCKGIYESCPSVFILVRRNSVKNTDPHAIARECNWCHLCEFTAQNNSTTAKVGGSAAISWFKVVIRRSRSERSAKRLFSVLEFQSHHTIIPVYFRHGYGAYNFTASNLIP